MNTLRSTITKALTAAALASFGLALAPTTAQALVLDDFRVDQSAISNCETAGSTPNTSFMGSDCVFTADKLAGNYNEILTVTDPVAGTFATEAYWDLGQFVANDGSLPVTNLLLNTNVSGDGYAIYALFSATGTFEANASGGFDFTGTGGSISLYLDASVDTTKILTVPAPSSTGLNNNGDDILLATATLLSGDGQTDTVTCDPTKDACGDFALVFDNFTLTSLGQQVFVYPVPFYLTATLKGQFNSFVPSGTQTINGTADAFFQPSAAVPEPATLTLLGLGLVGVSRFRQKRNKQK